MEAKRGEVVERMQKMEEECQPLLVVINDEGLVDRLRQEGNFTASYLEARHNVTPGTVGALFRFAKFKFECGIYADARNYLAVFRCVLVPPPRSPI